MIEKSKLKELTGKEVKIFLKKRDGTKACGNRIISGQVTRILFNVCVETKKGSRCKIPPSRIDRIEVKNNEKIETYYQMALSNSIFHSINEICYKECGKSLKMVHALFIIDKINLGELKQMLNHEGEVR